MIVGGELGSQCRRELCVVIPVFNEQDAIGNLLLEWLAELSALDVDYSVAIYDDGSTDQTELIVKEAAQQNARIRLVQQVNRGHGPTLMRAYHEARSEWIFQVDGDGELPGCGFRRLWENRHHYDLLIARRIDRAVSPVRRLITILASAWVRFLFGRGITDVNSPFRLVRESSIRALLDDMPAELIAPNVVLSGLAVMRGMRIYEAPLRNRPANRDSTLRGTILMGTVVRSFWQTLTVAVRVRRCRR